MSNTKKSVENEKLAAEIGKKVSNFINWREPFKQKWDRYYKLYRSYLEKKNYPWQSNIFVPYAFSTVETIVPRLVSTKPQVDAMPREKQDQVYAELQSAIIDYEWDMMDMDNILPDAIRQFLIYGTTILKVAWEKETLMVDEEVEIDPDFPELGKDKVKVEKTIKDQPVVELVDLYDFMWDPNGYDIETCSWVAHRTYRSYDYLMKMQKQGLYKNIAMLKDFAGKMYAGDTDKTERESAIDISDPKQYGSGATSESNIELIEYWEDNKLVTIANRTVIIREETQNPYKHGVKPFVRIVDQSVPKEFCGIGEIEPIETLQYELNDMRNQRMDNASMILNRMWIVANSANVDEDELVSDVGGVIHTEDINGIQPVMMPEIPNSSYREETLIKADIQQTTGITDYTKGVASDAMANETATGISLMQEAGSSRLRLKMMNLEEGIRKIGELMVSLNKQFITEERVIRITGDIGTEWVTVKPEDVYDNFDIRVQSGSTLEENDAIKRKQAMEMFQLFAGDPDVNQIELKKRVFQSRNEKNIDKLLNMSGELAAGQQMGAQQSLSNVPGGPAGMPGNSDRNAQGVMQSANELNRGIKETA
jgi:hypothetical protein